MASSRRVNFRLSAQDDTGRGTRSAAQNFLRLGRTIGRSLAGLGIAAATGLIARLTILQGRLDDLAKTADELAISPQVLRQLQLAAEIAGVTEEQFTRLLAKLRSGTEPVRKALEGLGIEFETFQRLTADQQVLTAIRAIAQVSGETERATAATALAGEELARVLLRLGNVGATEFAKIADGQEDVTDNFNEAARASERFSDALTTALAPIDNFLASVINKAAELIDRFNAFVQEDANELRAKFRAALSPIGDQVNDLIDVLRLGATAGAGAIEKNFQRAQEAIVKTTGLTKEQYDAVLKGLQAIIDLEERRRRAAQRGRQGEVGRDAIQFGPAQSLAARRAQGILDERIQRQQLQAQQELVKILREQDNVARLG